MSDFASQGPPTEIEPAEAGLTEPPDTKWPKVIGIISIVYASCGLACQFCGLGWVFLADWLMALGDMHVTTPLVIKSTMAASAVLMTCIEFLMLAGGIALVRRRRSGVSRLKAWAILRVVMIVVTVVIAILTLPVQVDYQRSVREAQNEMFRKNGQVNKIAEFNENATWTWAIVLAGVVNGAFAIYPVFIAFYLSRDKIRDEVETWE